MANYVDDLHDARKIVDCTVNYLYNLRNALFMVGNNKLGQDITFYIDDLNCASNLIKQGCGGAVNSHVTAASEGSTNMINAALAVTKNRDKST